jgi:3-deoxy-manno-octulosonate cytidylyltransferase (CMP-KDO synthetase)
MNYVVVIPARFKSLRLPGKPLVDIHGKSLLQRTYEQCIKAVKKELVYVATDSVGIYNHCISLNIKVEMTSEDCLTGTDRIAEFSKKVEADVYINVQGDEPLINPNDISKVIEAAKKHPNEIINGYASIVSKTNYYSLTIPKVVFRPDGRLLYMSRSPIPGNKNGVFEKSWRQICVYAFTKKALEDFSSLKRKTVLEQEEDIEILRFLELGYEVRMIELSKDSIAVDTQEDLELVRKIILKMSEIKVILWDFDGVILNSNEVRDRGFEEVLRDFPKEQVAKLLSYHRKNGGLSRYVKFRYFFEQIRGEKISSEEINKWAAKFSEIMFRKLKNKDLLFAETNKFIEENFQKYTMYIVSGSDQKELREICKDIGIEKYFKSIHGSPTAKNKLVEKLLKDNKYEKKQCVLIGDSINDYEAASINSIYFFAYNNNEIDSLTNCQICLN